jgi:hypothetical protein
MHLMTAAQLQTNRPARGEFSHASKSGSPSSGGGWGANGKHAEGMAGPPGTAALRRKAGNCQVGVSVHQVNEQASRAADWRLSWLESRDDTALDDPVATPVPRGAASGPTSPARCSMRRSGGWRWR